MTMELIFEASELLSLKEQIEKLPAEIRTKAMGRAMRRMRDMAKNRVIKRSAERTNIQQKYVRDMTSAYFNVATNTIEIREKGGWIPVAKMNPMPFSGEKGRPGGVSVRFKDARGSYKMAFLAKMKSGHTGVFKRMKDGQRLPIQEMFGPNPANDIVNHPEPFIELLSQLIENHLAGRVLHEVQRLVTQKL